ncbi:MAG: Crp/Fnr family transcriptional regulator [Bacteroidota bacterium]
MDALFQGLRDQIETLSKLEHSEWRLFKTYWKPLSFKKGKQLTKIGQVENYFYYVHKGVVRGYAFKDGEDISIGFSYKGDYTGAYDSFLTRKPSEWCMETITEVELARIHYHDLMGMFDRYKSIERWGRLFNAKMLIGMSRRQVESRSYTAEERFERLMKQSPHLFQLVSQRHIASYLGMTPETLSRLRKKVR